MEYKIPDPEISINVEADTPKFSLIKWIRNRFFTGVIIALPIVATVMAVTWIVQKIDNNVLGLIPAPIGNSIIKAGERLLERVPVVSPVYSSLKQIVTTVAQQKDRAFRDVCLLEYPRPGLWAYVCVFVPTTPNPTSGFLLFSKEEDIKILDMTPEEGAKMIISGGMVSSNEMIEKTKTSKSLT